MKINQPEKRKQLRKSTEQKTFCEMINKTDKSVARLIVKEEREDTITNVRYGRRKITKDCADIKIFYIKLKY